MSTVNNREEEKGVCQERAVSSFYVYTVLKSERKNVRLRFGDLKQVNSRTASKMADTDTEMSRHGKGAERA